MYFLKLKYGEECLHKTRAIVAEITGEDCFVVTPMFNDISAKTKAKGKAISSCFVPFAERRGFMKLERLVLLLLICFLLSSCYMRVTDTTDETDDAACRAGLTSESDGNQMINDGEFRGVVVGYVDFNDKTGDYTGFSLDEELALEIGDAVLKRAFGADRIANTEFIVQEYIYGYFVVTRFPYPIVPGYDFNVAINKEDGRILKIWMGE